MNRRGFFSTLAKAAAGFAILTSATTYTRKWIKTSNLFVPNPAWETAQYELDFFVEYNGILYDPFFFTKEGMAFIEKDFGKTSIA